MEEDVPSPLRASSVFLPLVALVALFAAWPGVTQWDVKALPTTPRDWEVQEPLSSLNNNNDIFNGTTTTTTTTTAATWQQQKRKPLVLVAGLSRTGTSSLQEALVAMNLTVYHTLETVSEHLDFWYYYLNGEVERPDVEKLIEPLGVDAIADCWFSYLAPEILKKYPDTKVILTTREPFESWLKSYVTYMTSSDLYHWHRQLLRLVASRLTRLLGAGKLLRFLRIVAPAGKGLDLEKVPLLMDVWKRVDQVVYGSTTPNPLWRSGYERHNAFIRAITPKENLLEFSLANGDSWPQILDFLDVTDPARRADVLDTPFPTLNCVRTQSCVSHLSARTTRPHERITLLFSVALLVASYLAFNRFFNSNSASAAAAKKPSAASSRIHVRSPQPSSAAAAAGAGGAGKNK